MTGIYPAADRVFRPWKNGGGTTAEILCWPKGAGFDDFTLRLSTARVDASGAFSVFPGVDRVLTVIEGGEMVLDFGPIRSVARPLQPIAFSGDAACQAQLDAPVLDFNVMVRRPITATVTVGPFDPGARFALLLQPAAGLKRLDMVDLTLAPPSLWPDLIGAVVISVTLSAPQIPA